jgi:hypothetical protein
MDLNVVVERLDVEWDTNGFFDSVRNGHYDAKRTQTVLDLLRAIHVNEEEMVPKRLVSLLWLLPSFLGWQAERIAEKGGDKAAYERFATEVHNILEVVLGTP